MKDYEEKFGIRFIGWYNVAHGWDFDNVILLDLPDYATLDKLEADEATRALGHRAGEWIFERHHSMFLRERMGPDLEYHPDPMSISTRQHAARRRANGRSTMDTATTTCSGSSRPTPPSSGPTSSSRPPSSSASSSTATRSASPSIGGLTLIDEEPDYLSIAPDLIVPQPQPLPRRD